MSRTTDWSRAQHLEIGTGGRLCPGIRTVNAVQSRSERARTGASNVRVKRTVRYRATKTPSTTIETCESESIKTSVVSARLRASQTATTTNERSLGRVDPRSRARRPRSREFLPSRALDARSCASKPARGKKPSTRATLTRLRPSSTPVTRARERFRARFRRPPTDGPGATPRGARARTTRRPRRGRTASVSSKRISSSRAMRSRRRVRDGARTPETSKRRGGRRRVTNGRDRSQIDRFANLWALGLSRSNEATGWSSRWRLNGVERITD